MIKIIDKKIFIPYALEIEAENISFDEGVRVLRHKVDDSWKIGTDRSLINGGIELASDVLTNTKETSTKLKKLSKTLKFLQATFEKASLQINLDANNPKTELLIYLFKVFSIYENIIYRFSTGLDNHIRKTFNDYALPIAKLFYMKYHMTTNLKESYEEFINNKSFALSLKTLTKNESDPIKVIEFRTPNGTDDFDLWMNYVIFFSSFLTCIFKKKFDYEYIDYLFERENYNRSIEELESIDEKKAIEFADLIYNNEEYKGLFFNQYFNKKL